MDVLIFSLQTLGISRNETNAILFYAFALNDYDFIRCPLYI